MSHPTINLKEFRKRNGIDQVSLAEFLHTSRSFVSLVESGRSKLPDDKIDKIINEGLNSGKWDLVPLNPEFFRLYELAETLGNDSQHQNENPVFDWKSGQSIFHITPLDLLKIKYGRLNITDDIAKAISRQFPTVNIEWLQYGNGGMFISGNQKPIKKDFSKKDNEDIKTLREEIHDLSMKIDEVISKLNIIIESKS